MKPSSAKTPIDPKAKRLIVLAFFCVSLVAADSTGCDYFRDGKPKDADGRLVAPAARAAKIGIIFIKWPGEDPIHLAIEYSGWMMKSPQRFPADDAKVEALIWNIGRLRSQKVLLNPGPSEIDRLGLNEPCLELDFGVPGRPVTKLTVGCNAKEDLLAIKASGEKDVHLVKTGLETLGAQKHEFFMSPLVLPADIPSLSSIEVRGPDEKTLKLSLNKEGEWMIAGEWGVLPADPEEAFGLAKLLTGLRSTAVVSTSTSPDKKSAGVFRIRLKTGIKQDNNVGETRDKDKPVKKKATKVDPAFGEYEVFVSESCPGKPQHLHIVRTKPYPAGFCVEKKIFSEIDFSPVKFLDPRPLRAETSHVETVEWFVKGKSSFRLEADRAGQWEIVWINGRRPADSGAVRERLGLLSQKNDVSLNKLSEKHRKTDCIKYSIRGKKTPNSLCLTDDPAPKGHVAVVRNEEPVALVVPEKIAGVLESTPLDFYDRVLFSHHLPNLPNLFIVRNGVRESLVRVGNHHELREPVFGRPDSASYSRLSSLFSRFAVKRFLPVAVSLQNLKKPELLIEVRPDNQLDTEQISTFSGLMEALVDFFAAGSKALRMEIGETTQEGECFGRIEDRAFVMDRKTCEILKTPLASLRIMGHLADGMITGMTFCKNNSCMVFKEDQGKWSIVSKSGDAIPSQSSIRNLLAITRGVTALEVAGYTSQRQRPTAAGYICLTRKRSEEAHLEIHQDTKTMMEDCLYLGSERFEINERKVGQAWVRNRPVIYNLSADLIDRLLNPF